MLWAEIVLRALAGVLASFLLSVLMASLEARPWKMRLGVGDEQMELDLANARASQLLLEAKIRALEEYPRIAPAGPDELLVVVARFRGPEEMDPQQYISSRLESELALHLALRQRVKIARYPDVIRGETIIAEREKAVAVGEECGAILVIWGQYDAAHIHARYLVTRGSEKAAMAVGLEERRAQLPDLDEFMLDVQTDLPEAISRASLFTIGRIYYSAGQYQEAISLLGSALECLPPGRPYVDGEAPLRFCRGTAYAKLGDYGRAIREYDRAIEVDPRPPVLYCNRGVAYAGLGRYVWAIADYGWAIEMDPRRAEFYSNRGAAYASLGEYGRAIEDFERAIEIAPEEARYHYHRACTESLRGYVSGAIEWLEKATALDAGYARMLETDPYLDRIRDDPRFKRFLARVQR